jgi:hypothetical protein
MCYMFYDFEATQDTKCTDTSYEHVPNLVCVQEFSAECEDEADMDVDCGRCGKRKHSFCTDLLAISFPTLLNSGRGLIEWYVLLTTPRRMTFTLY